MNRFQGVFYFVIYIEIHDYTLIPDVLGSYLRPLFPSFPFYPRHLRLYFYTVVHRILFTLTNELKDPGRRLFGVLDVESWWETHVSLSPFFLLNVDRGRVILQTMCLVIKNNWKD